MNAARGSVDVIQDPILAVAFGHLGKRAVPVSVILDFVAAAMVFLRRLAAIDSYVEAAAKLVGRIRKAKSHHEKRRLHAFALEHVEQAGR